MLGALTLAALLPLLSTQTAPAQAAAGDRIVTTDGRVHAGRILGEEPGGYAFEEGGAKSVIPFSSIASVERGAPPALPRPMPKRDETPQLRQQLTLAFDAYSLEKEKASITYKDKLFLVGVGFVTWLGGAAAKNPTGDVVRNIGFIELLTGGVMLGVTAIQDARLSSRIDEVRERQKKLEPAPAASSTLKLPVLAGRF